MPFAWGWAQGVVSSDDVQVAGLTVEGIDFVEVFREDLFSLAIPQS
jgi:hypothetical protein